jgi:hypothetical protein
MGVIERTVLYISHHRIAAVASGLCPSGMECVLPRLHWRDFLRGVVQDARLLESTQKNTAG